MIQLDILTPVSSRCIQAVAVFLPGTRSPFEVLPGHAPIISSLEAGRIRWRDADGKEDGLDIRSGLARVKDDVITACVELS
ncbi:MAG: hypothetical protein K6D54_05460 [Bacteroidales bacterium]|nr:hypothetical protein [Bacteroidales bacterium]